MSADGMPKNPDEMKKFYKDIIVVYLKEKRKEGSPPIEERRIYSDLKKEQNIGTIQVMYGTSLIKSDAKNGCGNVEITQRGGFIYYKYVGQL
jgi:hypothetical protein